MGKSLKSVVRAAALVTMSAVTVAMWSPPALAAGPDREAAIAAEVASDATQAIDSFGEDIEINSAADDSFRASSTAFTAVMPADPAVELSMDGQVVDFGITLVDGPQPADATVVDGDLVYQGDSGAPDYVLDTSSEGLRIMAVLEGPGDGGTQEYALTLPVGTDAVLNPGGGISIVASAPLGDGQVTAEVAVLAKPWAVDAEGKPVKTRYELQGNLLRQVVSPSSQSVYPITADPTYCTSFCYPFKVYFNKAESKTAANPGNAGIFIGACTVIGAALGGPVGAGIVGGLCAAQAGAITPTAQNGVNSRPLRCLRLDLYWPSSVLVPRTYTGSRCN